MSSLFLMSTITDRRTAEEAGCNGFITKPVMPRELKMYLDKYLYK